MIKVKFLHKGQEYVCYCASFEYDKDTGLTWFWMTSGVLYTRETIQIIWCYISELEPYEFMGYSDFPHMIK